MISLNKQMVRVLVGMAVFNVATATRADVVVVASAASGIVSLTPVQLYDIFFGKSLYLPNGALAMPVDQPEDSSERRMFYETYTGKSPAQVKAYWSKLIFTGKGHPPREAKGPNALYRIVSRNPGAIGYMDRSEVDNRVRIVKIME